MILFLAPLLTLKTAAMLLAERHVPFALRLSIPPRVFDFSSMRESLVTRYSVPANLSSKQKKKKEQVKLRLREKRNGKFKSCGKMMLKLEGGKFFFFKSKLRQLI